MNEAGIAMRLPCPYLTLPAMIVLALTFAADASNAVKVRLISLEATTEVDGTATLSGQSLSGHLTGNGIDISIVGTVKSATVSIEASGRIAANCGIPRQSMSGSAANDHESTRVDLVLQCAGSNAFLDRTYHYQLYLALPPHNMLGIPGPTDGESAALN